MLQDPYLLDETARPVVLRAIQRHCAYREWSLLAAHVRTNHVHVIVDTSRAGDRAETRPERIMNEFKSYSSRELNLLPGETPGRKRWARHGSTRWLWKDQDVNRALQYVVDEQGVPMTLFVAGEL